LLPSNLEGYAGYLLAILRDPFAHGTRRLGFGSADHALAPPILNYAIQRLGGALFV
jgi:hypothetical protein